jgi:anaerobic ribonucleoside-triphosphate reductase activating protein
MELRIHRFLPRTHVEGPGERACLWVQGCPLRCPGCAVPSTWPNEGGEIVQTGDLAQRIVQGPRVEGVTFAGGEPFAQAAALAALGRSLRNAGLSVTTFTGYQLQDIVDSGRREWLDLVAVTDLLIDGPYRRDLADLTRPWVGSANQRYHFLTDRYRHLGAGLPGIANRWEIRLQSDGAVLINGMGDLETVRELIG